MADCSLVENCQILDNHGYVGGALEASGGGTYRFVNGLIANNDADEQAGVALFTGHASPGSINCTIAGNHGSNCAIWFDSTGSPRAANCVLWGHQSSVVKVTAD